MSDAIPSTDEDRTGHKTSPRDYLDMITPHFHVCRGNRVGGHFFQDEAWQARETVINHVVRIVDNLKEVNNE